MKTIFAISMLILPIFCECYYQYKGEDFYCQECCYWYDGEWYCETYSYCYTVIAVTLACWIIICILYLGLYFWSKQKTEARVKRIHEIAAQAQREAVKIEKNQDQPTETEKTLEQKYDQPSITMQNVEILNDQL